MNIERQHVRAAVVQGATTPFDSAGAVALVGDWVARASEDECQLVVFPEAFVGGYPKGSTFGAYFGGRTEVGRNEFSRYFGGAISVPGPETEMLGAVSAKHRVHLVVGVIERSGGTLYCTVVFLAPDGTLLGKRRKLMPTGGERMVWGFGDGSTMNVYDTSIGRLGAVICWENMMPAARMAMYDQGIELYCAPTADGREGHHATMRHIGQEGRCFVLAANQVMRVAEFPPDHPRPFGEDPDTVVCRGGSSIIGPLGQVLAGPVYDTETLLVADLRMADLPGAKYDFDVTGHYARPDVFRLEVNRSPQRAVTSKSSLTGDTADPAEKPSA